MQYSGTDVLNQAIDQIDSTLQKAREYAQTKKGITIGEIMYRYKEDTSVLIIYWE